MHPGPEAADIARGFNKTNAARGTWNGPRSALDVHRGEADAATCIRVDPHAQNGEGSVEEFGDPKKIGTLKYKYEGAVIGADGRSIYCLPGDADRVLKIQVSRNGAEPEVSMIGPSFSSYCRSNKFQNGFLSTEGIVYASPCNAQGVLRIDTATDEVTVIHPATGPLEGLDKYQSGVYVKSADAFYCMPFKAHNVLKIQG